MRIKDVMQPKVITVAPGTPVRDAFALMQAGGFRHLPVLDGQRNIVGIVSDRDLRAVGSTFKNPDTGADEFLVTEDKSVDTIMVADPVCASPNDSIARATKIIRDKRIGCLLVTESERLVGILSYLDILDAATAEQDEPRETPRDPADTQPLDKNEITTLRRQLQEELHQYRVDNPTPKQDDVAVRKRSSFMASTKKEREEHAKKVAEANSRIMDDIASQLDNDEK